MNSLRFLLLSLLLSSCSESFNQSVQPGTTDIGDPLSENGDDFSSQVAEDFGRDDAKIQSERSPLFRGSDLENAYDSGFSGPFY